MAHLYRVVPKAHWNEALRTGAVPRCPADQRHDRVHLNRLDDVEVVANLWFTVEEEPLVLEVDISRFAMHLSWDARTDPPEGVWPSLYIDSIPISSVVRVLSLELTLSATGGSTFQLSPIPEESSDAAARARLDAAGRL